MADLEVSELLGLGEGVPLSSKRGQIVWAGEWAGDTKVNINKGRPPKTESGGQKGEPYNSPSITVRIIYSKARQKNHQTEKNHRLQVQQEKMYIASPTRKGLPLQLSQ